MKWLLSLLVPALLLAALSPAQAEPVSFKKDIAPILLDNCLACHGPKKAEGGYRVDSFERLLKAGDSGAAGIVAKDHDGSEVLRRITSDDEAERMPLDGDPLPPEQVELVRRWISEGATYDGGDPNAPLATILPPPTHPAPPEAYVRPVPITAVAFHPDGQQLYVAGYHEISVWNPNDGQLLRRISGIGQRVFQISFSPDGKLVAVAGGSPGRLGEVRILNAADGSLVTAVAMTSDVVFDAQFNPQGDRLATAAADGVVRLFDVASWKEQQTITSHSDWVMAVAWSDDGSKLASASRDKTAKVYDAQTGDLLVTFSQHNAPVRGVHFKSDASEVYSSGSDNQVRRFDLAEGKQKGNAGLGDEIYKLVSAGPEHFLAPSADKSLRLYRRGDGGQAKQLNGMTDAALCAAWHGETQRVAAGGFDGRVVVWNLADDKVVASFIAAPGYQAP